MMSSPATIILMWAAVILVQVGLRGLGKAVYFSENVYLAKRLNVL